MFSYLFKFFVFFIFVIKFFLCFSYYFFVFSFGFIKSDFSVFNFKRWDIKRVWRGSVGNIYVISSEMFFMVWV